MKKRVGIIGASGYTGAELFGILLRHQKVDISFLSSRSAAGKKVSEVFPQFINSSLRFVDTEKILEEVTDEDVDLVFLALPHEASIEIVYKLWIKKIKVIDLSASYRFKSKEMFESTYKISHTHPELLEETVWGLPEYFRDQIKKACIIGNPGCYPTSVSLALGPLREIKDKVNFSSLVIDSKSGISGKGKKVTEDSIFVEHNENFYAYGLPYHRHTPEIEQFIESVIGIKTNVLFSPHVVPMDRGIFSSIYIEAEGINSKILSELYHSYYDREPFVHFLDDQIPQTKWVWGTNNCFINAMYLDRVGKIFISSVIDNLGKGASGQAVQNMNIVLDLPETSGLM